MRYKLLIVGIIVIIALVVDKATKKPDSPEKIANDSIAEYWKSNSLNTGDTPYSTCLSSNNDCSEGSCSNISVKTGGNDVLVMIKDIKGETIRHAYIKAGDEFTFNIADGKYQAFFYSGSGWNPNKAMQSTACENLIGGFVSSESFTKDEYISLQHQIMNYELILQTNGNLRTEPSSMKEAFN